VDLKSPADGLGRKIAFSTENRRDEGIIGDLTVRENLILAVQAERGWARPISRREQAQVVDTYMAALNVRPADPDRLIKNLSGGNQQKVLLGRWLERRSHALLLVEPTRGVDVGARQEIYRSIRALSAQGVGVLIPTSDYEEVVQVADRVAVMARGRIVARLAGDEITTEALTEAAGG